VRADTRSPRLPRNTLHHSDRFGPLRPTPSTAYGGTEAVKQELSDRLGGPLATYLIIQVGSIRAWETCWAGVEVDVPKTDVLRRQQPGPLHRSPTGRQKRSKVGIGGLLARGHDVERRHRAVSIAKKLVLAALFSKSSVRRGNSAFRLSQACSRALSDDVKNDLRPDADRWADHGNGHPTTLNKPNGIGGPALRSQDGISYWEAVGPPSPLGSNFQGRKIQAKAVFAFLFLTLQAAANQSQAARQGAGAVANGPLKPAKLPQTPAPPLI